MMTLAIDQALIECGINESPRLEPRTAAVHSSLWIFLFDNLAFPDLPLMSRNLFPLLYFLLFLSLMV